MSACHLAFYFAPLSFLSTIEIKTPEIIHSVFKTSLCSSLHGNDSRHRTASPVRLGSIKIRAQGFPTFLQDKRHLESSFPIHHELCWHSLKSGAEERTAAPSTEAGRHRRCYSPRFASLRLASVRDGQKENGASRRRELHASPLRVGDYTSRPPAHRNSTHFSCNGVIAFRDLLPAITSLVGRAQRRSLRARASLCHVPTLLNFSLAAAARLFQRAGILRGKRRRRQRCRGNQWKIQEFYWKDYGNKSSKWTRWLAHHSLLSGNAETRSKVQTGWFWIIPPNSPNKWRELDESYHLIVPYAQLCSDGRR